MTQKKRRTSAPPPLSKAFIISLSFGLVCACRVPNGVGAGSSAVNTPVTINLGPDSTSSVSDYQASVKVFYANNKVAVPQKLTQSYRLSTKNIDGNIYVRLDYDANSDSGVKQRSVVTGPNGTLVLSADASRIEQRIPVKAELKGQMAIGEKSLFSKIDPNSMRQKMMDLGYDVADEKSKADSHIVVFSAPSGLLPKSLVPNTTAHSFKVRFDAEMGTMAGTELVEVRVDGCVVTKTIEKYYQDVDGVIVPVGERLDIHYDFPGSLTLEGEIPPAIADPESLPKLSKEEFEKMKDEGSAYEVPMAVIGDLSDPDYTESWITVYETVSTNCLDKSLFKLAEVM